MDLSGLWSNPLLPFCIIIILSLLIPEAVKRFGITTVPFFILAGIVLGPFGVGMQVGEGLIFLGDLGLFVLIFMAGMEIHEMGKIRTTHVTWYVAIITLLSFGGGFALGLLLGFSLLTSCLIGTILISSSIGEIIPLVNSSSYLKCKLGHIIIPVIVIIDIISITLLGIIVKVSQSYAHIFIFIAEVLLLQAFMFLVMPFIIKRYFRRSDRKPREGDLKFIIAVLMVSVVLGYLIGLHGIVTAFVAGLVVGRIVPTESVYKKVHGIGHGMLIPVFFIVLGMRLEIDVVLEGTKNMLLPVLLIGTLVIVKLLGGLLFSRLIKFPLKDGLLLGLVLLPQLSATLAATQIGYETGIFEQDVLVSVVIMSLVTVLGTPFIVKLLTRGRTIKTALRDHFVIAGYGRTTSKIAYLLERSKVPMVVIDLKHSRLDGISCRGIPTVLGNAASRKVLEDAQVGTCRLVILSISDDHDLLVCASRIRKMNPKCRIIAIVHTEGTLRELKAKHLVDEYIWPEKRSAREISEMVFPYL